MPLSELYRLGKRRGVDSNQDFEGGNSDVYELVWENGQITTTQGQSSRGRRDSVVSATTTLPSHCLPSYTPKSRERDVATRTVKFGSFSDAVPISEDLGLTHHHHNNEDDDMITWLNYPIDHSDYCPEYLPALSGISTVNPNPNPSSVPKPNANGGTNTTANNVINFSHFSRPIGLARAHNNNNGGSLLQTIPSIEGMSIKDKDAICPKPKQPEAVCESTTRGLPPPPLEPVVASSSVCSGNSVERASDEPDRGPKRKFRDAEDSECHSDDVEEESVGVKKTGAARGSGSKRSRAAEVHNLSERKRRDRINEKMRALQELIPNCNKVDKASMLDEAIEYLKTLQLQVQIMSMGAGLCMPPMMMPHHHHHHMAQFPPMGMGMGMGLGMGYGMGVPDMMHGGMAGPSLQVYGVPSQGVSMMIQRPHLVPPMMAAPFARPADSPHPYASNIPASFSNQTSTQCQSVNRALEKSAVVQNNVQQSDARSGNAPGPANDFQSYSEE